MTTLDDLISADDGAVLVRDIGDIRVVVLNRPAKRNALSRDMRRTLASAFDSASADDSVRVVVLTGAGGSFCAGLDTSEPPLPGVTVAVRPNPGEAALAFPKPLIAAVDGVCVTGGLELALSCSFVIASGSARFADTHAKFALLPAWGLTALLPRAIGVRRARQLSLTGTFIDSATALSWGLVNEVVPGPVALDRALVLAESIAATDRLSQRTQLSLIARTIDLSLGEAIAEERHAAEAWEQRRRNPITDDEPEALR
ncbi:MAG: enoyl-CoA hydratase [Subtercola sp.]|nr:enoyl-CoA hydratase [Subtercola sp.]